MATVVIVQGKLVPIGALLQVVGLTYQNQRQPECTGTLIGQKLVLTAAHCVCNLTPTHVFVGQDPTLGAGGRSEYYPVSDVRAAAPCDGDLRGRDFALVKLDRKVPNLRALEFPPDTLADRSVRGRVSGYGATDVFANDIDYRKREAAVPMQSVDCTEPGLASDLGCVPQVEMIAGKRQFPDTCKGDSGGPLLISPSADEGGTVFGKFYVVGVTSRAVDGYGTACGNGGIYARLNSRAREWVARARTSMGV